MKNVMIRISMFFLLGFLLLQGCKRGMETNVASSNKNQGITLGEFCNSDKYCDTLKAMVKRGMIDLSDTTEKPFIKHLFKQDPSTQDSILAEGRKYREYKAHWDSIMIEYPGWQFTGRWEEGGPMEWNELLFFHNGVKIIDTINVRDLLPYNTEKFPDLNVGFSIRKSNLTYEEIKKYLGDMEFKYNPYNLPKDTLLKHWRSFKQACGSRSVGDKTIVIHFVKENLINAPFDETVRLPASRKSFFLVLDHAAKNLRSEEYITEWHRGSPFLSTDGRYLAVEKDNFVELHDFENGTSSKLFYDGLANSYLLDWVSNTKFRFHPDVKDSSGVERYYDVESNLHYISRISRFEKCRYRYYTEDGIRSMEGCFFPYETDTLIVFTNIK